MRTAAVTAERFATWGQPEVARDTSEGKALETARELDRFLKSVERKAFRIARFAVNDTDEALDIVQDAMMQLARRYAGKPEDELRPLFYRILKNRIRDWQRRSIVRSKVMAWFGTGHGDDEDADPIQRAPDTGNPATADRVMIDESMVALDASITALPKRQQQALLLRLFEGMDVAATARAMGCSEGSVKTHYSRAVHALREKLGDFMP